MARFSGTKTAAGNVEGFDLTKNDMTQDELEFLIVQHVDGTIDPAEAPRLAALLATDASARSLLGEHERLAKALRAAPPLAIDADWLSSQIASHLDEAAEVEASRSYKLPRWSILAPMAAAALLMITLTLGVVFHRDDGDPIPREVPSTVVASVTGPSAETANVARQMSVSVGAPANLSASMVTALFLAEQFPSQGRVIVRPAGAVDHRAFE